MTRMKAVAMLRIKCVRPVAHQGGMSLAVTGENNRSACTDPVSVAKLHAAVLENRVFPGETPLGSRICRLLPDRLGDRRTLALFSLSEVFQPEGIGG